MSQIKAKKSKKTSKAMQPSVSAVVYRGPSVPSRYLMEDVPVTVPIGVSNTLAASAGGVLATVLDAITQITTTTDWTSIALLYKEYRVLSMHVDFGWIDPYSTGVTKFPIFSATDRQDNTAIASLTDASSRDSARMHQWGKKFTRELKMDTVEESVWTSISNTPSGDARLYIKLYGNGLGASANIFQYYARYLVQVKGRQ